MAGYFDDAFIDQVRESNNITEVVGGYITLKQKSAGDFWGTCPFHSEKTASFHVMPARQMYHCFGCGRGGNIFTFLMEMEGISFPEAIKTLAERVGIPLPRQTSTEASNRVRTERDSLYSANALAAKWFHSNLTKAPLSSKAEKALSYLQDRGISDEIIKRYMIGWAEDEWDGLIKWCSKSGISGSILHRAGLALKRKDGSGFVDKFRARIMFPIFSLSGKPIAFGGRRLEGVTPDSDDAKYVNSSDTGIFHKGENLYGLFTGRDLIRREKSCYLVEGYTDLLALIQAGVENVVASLGTALTQKQALLIGRFAQKVNIVFDSDAAGINAALRASELFTLEGMETRLIRLPDNEDPDSLLRSENGKEKLLSVLKSDSTFIQFYLESAGIDRSSGQTERLKAARDLLETINHVSNPIQKEQLLTELSQMIGVQQATLDKAVASIKSTVRQSSDSPERRSFQVAQEQVGEVELLRALLAHPGLITETVTEMTADLIEQPHLNKLYRTLERAYLIGEKIDPSSLPEKYDDPSLRAFIAEASMDSVWMDEEEAKKALQGSMTVLQRRNLLRRHAEIEYEITQAGQQGKDTTDLLREIGQLHKKIREIESSI